MGHTFFLFLFFVLCILNIVTNKPGPSKKEALLAGITKILVVPALLMLAFSYTLSIPVIFIAALLACLGGDMALELPFKRQEGKVHPLVILGACFFLVGHVLYTILFLETGIGFLVKNPLISLSGLPYLLYAVIVLPFCREKGAVRIAAFFYLLAVSCMSFSALLQLLNSPGPGPALIFSGTLFFVGSDSILGIRGSSTDPVFGGRLVMGTYLSAQLLIVTGFLIS